MTDDTGMHPCPVPGCHVEHLPFGMLLCGPHWRRVPRGLQLLVYISGFSPKLRANCVILTIDTSACRTHEAPFSVDRVFGYRAGVSTVSSAPRKGRVRVVACIRTWGPAVAPAVRQAHLANVCKPALLLGCHRCGGSARAKPTGFTRGQLTWGNGHPSDTAAYLEYREQAIAAACGTEQP